MRVLVVGGYGPDRLQSMNRYGALLVRLYSSYCCVSYCQPLALFSRLPFLPLLARKYLAYIDKLILFPLWLALCSRFFDRVHIADHGYSYYSFFCPKSRCIVTCHDLLAVRGAMGDHSAYTSASLIGIWLQRLILSGLRCSGALVFDSQATYSDYLFLGGGHACQRHQVLPLPLNAPFSADSSAFPLSCREESLIPPHPYLLMVGSASLRKNRALALRILINLGSQAPYKLVLAGAPLSDPDKSLIAENQLHELVLSVTMPSHALLNHLYCKAHALLFPSFSEGFGWPLLEAQACACPVIASTTTSIPEVAGPGALYADPTDDLAFTRHVIALEDPVLRECLIKKGFLNIQRFDPEAVSRQLAAFAFGYS